MMKRIVSTIGNTITAEIGDRSAAFQQAWIRAGPFRGFRGSQVARLEKKIMVRTCWRRIPDRCKT